MAGFLYATSPHRLAMYNNIKGIKISDFLRAYMNFWSNHWCLIKKLRVSLTRKTFSPGRHSCTFIWHAKRVRASKAGKGKQSGLPTDKKENL